MPLFRFSFVFCIVALYVAGFVYYPKWKQSGTEATISWDVSGYYMYLPAIFIYKDIKNCGFKDYILETYNPTPDFQQAFEHPSGSLVMKYSIGQAVQYLPAFTIAHLYTLNFTSYPADGFSQPYQLSLSINALLVAFLGLFFLSKALLCFFSPLTTSITLIAIVLGSNYLDYSAINGAMTHNGLFTIYAALLWFTIKYHAHPSKKYATIIGLLIGLAALTRPTEIIACIIPLVWGIRSIGLDSLKSRVLFFYRHWKHVIIASLMVAIIGSIQLYYWKYVTGEWIVYSYEDQGFSWLKPHLWEGIFSYKSGWLLYSPIFLLVIPGFVFLRKSRDDIFYALLFFTILFIYIAFAWDIWWYGGSLGQRAMVQAYPILAIPLAVLIERVKASKYTFGIIGIFIAFCITYNLWLTHHAHRGGLFHAGQMTKAYFWKTIGKNDLKEDYLKLLDTDEELTGKVNLNQLLYFNDFEQDSFSAQCNVPPISGEYSLCLSEEIQFTPQYKVPLVSLEAEWIRASALIKCINKEWEVWRMAQFITKFYENGKEIKSRLIRVHRHLSDNEIQEISFETRIPEAADEVGVYFWNAGSNKSLLIDDLKITGIK